MSLWNIIRPANFYARDWKIFNLAAKRKLTSKDILEIEYGEFPMKGINITETNERPVSIRGLLPPDHQSRIW